MKRLRPVYLISSTTWHAFARVAAVDAAPLFERRHAWFEVLDVIAAVRSERENHG